MASSDTLYHYTDSNGLLGILGHMKLWMTHHSFLNDSREIEYGMSLVEKVAKRLKHKLPDDSFAQWQTQFSDGKFFTSDQDYILCFSTQRDQLSQWRAYSDDGTGFCIGFDRKLLEKTAGKLGWCDGPVEVVYKRSAQIKMLEACISDGLIESEVGLLEIWDLLMAECAARFKSDAFSEESEWRMRTLFVDEPESHDKTLSPTMHFRSTKYGIAPYVEFPFPRRALSEIVVGPKSPMRKKHWVLNRLLQSAKITRRIKIRNSTASYR